MELARSHDANCASKFKSVSMQSYFVERETLLWWVRIDDVGRRLGKRVPAFALNATFAHAARQTLNVSMPSFLLIVRVMFQLASGNGLGQKRTGLAQEARHESHAFA